MIWFWVATTFILYALALWQRWIIRRYQQIVAEQRDLLDRSILLTDTALEQGRVLAEVVEESLGLAEAAIGPVDEVPPMGKVH